MRGTPRPWRTIQRGPRSRRHGPSMPLIEAVAAPPSKDGPWFLRLAGSAVSFAAAVWVSITARLLPPGRRMSRVIGLAGTVIVMFIAGLTNLILREIEE